MMNKVVLHLTLMSFICFLNSCENKEKPDVYEALKEGFKNPPAYAKPKVYWWCLNGNIDTIRAKQEFLDMKKAGIGGFDLFEIGVPKEDTMIPGGPAFLSDESLKVIKFAVKEAGELGLEMGLNLASSWNAGGSWTLPENAGKSLYYSKISVKGGPEVQKINVPFPEISFPKASLIGGSGKSMIPFQANGRPGYYEEVTILAIPANMIENSLDTGKIINVTRFFDPAKDLLNWKVPSGEWEILRYVCSNSGQQLVLPSPHSAGLTIDHFDSTAVRTHLMYIINRLKTVLGDFRNTALKSFYLASYEARGFVWTSSLPSEFKKVNGYAIYKFLPSFFDQKLFSEEITKKVQVDFKETLSELMINNLYKNAKQICNSYGLKINCEAGGPGYPLYNGPAEPLKALGALDIPRGEFWINHSRYYKDSNGKDSIDILRVVKEVAAASHIYEKGIVEEEAFTSFQHWQEGPFDMKPYGDRAFCEGMNKVVVHGFSHNPGGSGFPGFVYHAGTHFNNKRVWWPKIKPFNDYLSRISSVLQNANFVADVLYYYGDKIPNSATPKNTHFTVGPGYDYEVINTEILLTGLIVKNRKLILSNGACFSMLALEEEDKINPAVLAKLNELAGQGAIIVGEKPKKVADLKKQPVSVREGENLINEIWTEVSDLAQIELSKKGKVYSGIKPLDMINVLDISPDINYSDKEMFLLDYIHYNKNNTDFYFIRNTTNEWVSRTCAFRQLNKIPEIWDPVSGDIIPVTIYNKINNTIDIPITLPPYGAMFVVFKESPDLFHFTTLKGTDDNPPLLEFTNDGICFLQDGSFEIKTSDQSIFINNNPTMYTIDGPWEVSFTAGWGAPEKVIFPELISWTLSENEGIKYYSGIATYKKTFQYDLNSTITRDRKIYLDLGDISKVGDVWLNGEHLGITWAKPYTFDITNILKNGENAITVEIANTWSNRLKGDALTGHKFTNTNIKNTIIPSKSIEPSDQTRVPWAEVPLIKSGLLGPVTIKSVKPVAMSKYERIDTHIHLYDTRRVGSCIFLDPVDRGKIYFPHFIDEFIKVAHPAGIKYAIVIEASFRREDNYWLATLAENSNIIKAFLANLDPRDPYFANDLDSLLHYKKFRGIRIRTEKKIDLSMPEIIKTIGELEKHNLVLEVNRYDPGIVKIARKYPKMTIIMDHLAGGHIENGSVQPKNWKESLAFMAAEPNIYCKISALYTLSGQIPAPTDPAFYKPLIDPVIDTFGTERVMFGSDWPLSEMGGSYADMITMYNAYLNGRADLIPQQFYFYNALKAYGIE